MNTFYAILVVYNQSIQDSCTYRFIKEHKSIHLLVCDNSTSDYGNKFVVESDGYTYIKSGFCGLDSIKSNITILKITENNSEMKITFCLDSFDHSSLSAQTQYILTVYKNEGNDLIYSLVYGD